MIELMAEITYGLPDSYIDIEYDDRAVRAALQRLARAGEVMVKREGREAGLDRKGQENNESKEVS